mgnify:CR=1 FL=1
MRRASDSNKEHIMKKLTIMLLTCLLALDFSVQEAAAQGYQQTPVTVSKEKVRLNGKVYYSHVVLEKQTLFSVAKAYGVTMQDIIKANPALDLGNNGLKKNQIVLIPAELVNTAAEPEEQKAEEIDDRLPSPIKVKEESPAGEETAGSAIPEKMGNKDYFIHIVKWYEDLSDIAKKYGMSEETIMRYNGMKSSKVKKKMRLKIPYRPDETVTAKEPEEVSGPDGQPDVPVAPAADTLEVAPQAADSVEVNERDVPWYKTIFTGKRNVDVSLLIPLNADKAVNENFADFYAGALLAARDLGTKDGISLDISVYDVASGNIPLTKEGFEGSDIVIGPVSRKDITTALEVCPRNKFIISPLDPGVSALAATTSNLIHAPTPASFQYKDIADWVREDMGSGDRVLLITEKEAKESTAATSILAALDSSRIEYKTLSYGILEGRNIDRAMAELLSREAPNRIILASESEAFVGDVVRNLNLLIHGKYAITLYSPSKIRTFDTIDVESLHNVNLHVSTTYFIDYDDPRVRNFLLAYRALYKTEPSQFAFQGYDVMDYFTRMYSKYGRNWYKMASRGRTAGLQADYKFVEFKDGGFTNGAVRRVTYDPGYTITLVKNYTD